MENEYLPFKLGDTVKINRDNLVVAIGTVIDFDRYNDWVVVEDNDGDLTEAEFSQIEVIN